MIQYPEDYFNEEIRCGFRITELMKRCWAAQIEVLGHIEKICEKYNLNYFADYGTLLGAVRHKGFIPWDDDMDISLKREDFMMLMKLAPHVLPDGYQLLSIYNAPDWSDSFARIVNTKVLPMPEGRENMFYGFPLAAGIDIFPIDYIPRNKELADVQQALLNLTWRMIANLIRDGLGKFNKEQHEQIKKELQEAIVILAEFCSIPSFQEHSLLQVFYLIFDQLCMLGTEKDSDYCTVISTFNKHGYSYKLKNEWCKELVDMSFEYSTVKVPSEYEKVLVSEYSNYMNYQRNSQAHGYPYYQNNLRTLKEMGVWSYKEDPKDLGVPDEEVIPGDVSKVSDSWKSRVEQAKKEGRRVALFQPMLTSLLAKEERYIETIDKLLELFLNNRRVLIWFRPHVNEHVPYMDVRPELFAMYNDMCCKYQNQSDFIYDDTDNQLGAMELSDIYIGDPCPIAEHFKTVDKRVFMIEVGDNYLERFVNNF